MLTGTLISEKPQTIDPRHWSSDQSYITGDVLAQLIAEGWGVSGVKEAAPQGRARMYLCAMERANDSMAIRVLDGPFVRSLAKNLDY